MRNSFVVETFVIYASHHHFMFFWGMLFFVKILKPLYNAAVLDLLR